MQQVVSNLQLVESKRAAAASPTRASYLSVAVLCVAACVLPTLSATSPPSSFSLLQSELGPAQ